MNTTRKTLSVVMVLTLIVSLCACATTSRTTATPAADATQGDRIEGATMEIVRSATPLKTAYTNVVFNRFEASDQINTDYPDVLTTCKLSIISHLRGKNAFAKVAEDAGQTYPGKTVLVDGKIEDMRIASTAARIWGGAFAGASFMDIRIRLTDAASKAVIHEKVISSSTNAFAAAWNMGASDKSLPMDMGKIIGEYLYTIIPAKK